MVLLLKVLLCSLLLLVLLAGVIPPLLLPLPPPPLVLTPPPPPPPLLQLLLPLPSARYTTLSRARRCALSESTSRRIMAEGEPVAGSFRMRSSCDSSATSMRE